MWGPIIQFLTLFGGGVAAGKILENQQPVIVHTTPSAPAAASAGDAFSPLLIIAIAILVLAAGYVIRVFRRQG